MKKPNVPRETSEFTIDEPSHWLYCGVTETGKTTLARFHSRKLSTAKHRVLVYDPVMTETAGGDWGKVTLLPADPEKAAKAIERSRDAFVFIDEARDLLGHRMLDNHWMLRQGRHQNLYFRLCCQRPTMLPPDVRTQCSRFFIFRLARTDLQEILADCGHSQTTAGVSEGSLDKGDCVMIMSGSKVVDHFNCFDLVGGSAHSDKPPKGSHNRGTS